MAGGIATASAVAGIYDVLVGTVHDGSRYGAVLGDAIRVHRRDTDRVLGAEDSRGLGFRVGDPGNRQQAFPFDAPSQTVGLTARGYADPAVRDVAAALLRTVATVAGF